MTTTDSKPALTIPAATSPRVETELRAAQDELVQVRKDWRAFKLAILAALGVTDPWAITVESQDRICERIARLRMEATEAGRSESDAWDALERYELSASQAAPDTAQLRETWQKQLQPYIDAATQSDGGPAASVADTAQFEQAVGELILAVMQEGWQPSAAVIAARAALLSLFAKQQEKVKQEQYTNQRMCDTQLMMQEQHAAELSALAALTPRKAAGAPTRADGDQEQSQADAERWRYVRDMFESDRAIEVYVIDQRDEWSALVQSGKRAFSSCNHIMGGDDRPSVAALLDEAIDTAIQRDTAMQSAPPIVGTGEDGQ